MYAKTLILTAGLTLLGTVPAAWAQYRADDRPYPPTYEQRGPDYAPDYGQVVRAAREIQQAAASINFQAFHNNRRPNEQEAQMLDRLRDLSTRARHFQAVVTRSRPDPRYTANDFQALVDSFDATVDSLRATNPRPYIDKSMNRIAYLMDQMAPYYGQEAGFRSLYSDRDRDQDRDAYRHRDQDRDRDSYRPPVR